MAGKKGHPQGGMPAWTGRPLTHCLSPPKQQRDAHGRQRESQKLRRNGHHRDPRRAGLRQQLAVKDEREGKHFADERYDKDVRERA
jgi:hypothetical protein